MLNFCDTCHNESNSLKPLGQHPIFEGMADDLLGLLLRQGERRKYRPDEVIVRFGDKGERYFLLESGTVRIFYRAEGGAEVLARLIGAPAAFGELELIVDTTYTMWVSALEACELIEIPKTAFLEALDRSPQFARNLLTDVSTRFLATILNARSLAFDPGEARLARILSDYASLFGVPVAEGTKIRIKLTQDDLADATALNRRSVVRILNRWTREGRIAKQAGHYVIRDKSLTAQYIGRFSLVHKLGKR